MDESEKVANDYLVHLGFRTVVYEPDGKVPPDLLADGRIAVEVRRLNQNELTESEYCGLEETRIPLQMTIRKLLASLGPAKSGASWFVHYTLRRPLPARAQLLSKLRQRLEAFRDDPRDDKPTSIAVDDSLRLTLFRAGDPRPAFFLAGGYSDSGSGGFVFEETPEEPSDLHRGEDAQGRSVSAQVPRVVVSSR